jgi:hypothetical protein
VLKRRKASKNAFPGHLIGHAILYCCKCFSQNHPRTSYAECVR